jgi:Arc/MetJ family transcription regulator
MESLNASLDSTGSMTHTKHMKRTNLVLDEGLLQEAMRLSGEATYSRTVGRALEELVRLIRARRILDLARSGLWEGDLADMRSDKPLRRRKRAAR